MKSIGDFAKGESSTYCARVCESVFKIEFRVSAREFEFVETLSRICPVSTTKEGLKS